MTLRKIESFSAQQKREYADEHVCYEITHFVRAIEAIRAALADKFPMNFAIEVFSIHLRNLLDFFYPPSNEHSHDVFARDFFSDPSRWNPVAKSQSLSDWHLKAHKEIAHLTTERHTDPAMKQWDVDAIYAEMRPLIEAFLGNADLIPDRLQPELATILAGV